MGNCIFNKTNSMTLHDKAKKASIIKVVTTMDGIMELYAPIIVEQITSEFPNHFISLSSNPSDPPLLNKDTLTPGQLYYLLPLSFTPPMNNSMILSTRYRMSVDLSPRTKYIKNHGSGVWNVRLAINREHLSKILSQNNETFHLIESARTVAKCGSSRS